MSLAIVRTRAAIHGNSIPNADASVTFPSAPTVGNLLIAFVGINIANSSLVINSAKWNLFEQVFTSESNNGSTVMLGLYRYVDGTDTATLPPFATAGSTYWSDCVVEISGASGNFENDLLFCMPIRPYRARLSGSTGAPFRAIDAPTQCLAIAATVAYNGNANPSVGGSWTVDQSLNNSGNYGSASVSHRAMSAGQTIDGTPVHASSSGPWGAMLLMLNDGTYPTTPWVRRIWDRSSGAGQNIANSSPSLPWVPRQGALLLNTILWQRGDQSGAPTTNSGWTEYKSINGTAGKQIVCTYRYVQVGDTGALPAITTSNSGYNAEVLCEITGLSSTFSLAHAGNDYSARQASGGAMTTTADATTANNQLALIWFGHYNASNDGNTITGTGWIDFPFFDVGSYGGWNLGVRYVPTSGTSVSATLTPDTTSDTSSYVQTLWGAAGSSGPAPFNALNV